MIMPYCEWPLSPSCSMMMMMFHHPRDILCQSQHRSALSSVRSFVRSFVRSKSGLPRYRVTSTSISMSRTVVVVCCLLTLLFVVVDVVQNIQLYRYPAQGIDYFIPVQSLERVPVPVCRFGISFPCRDDEQRNVRYVGRTLSGLMTWNIVPRLRRYRRDGNRRKMEQ